MLTNLSIVRHKVNIFWEPVKNRTHLNPIAQSTQVWRHYFKCWLNEFHWRDNLSLSLSLYLYLSIYIYIYIYISFFLCIYYIYIYSLIYIEKQIKLFIITMHTCEAIVTRHWIEQTASENKCNWIKRHIGFKKKKTFWNRRKINKKLVTYNGIRLVNCGTPWVENWSGVRRSTFAWKSPYQFSVQYYNTDKTNKW